jgi:hypothetical protein
MKTSPIPNTRAACGRSHGARLPPRLSLLALLPLVLGAGTCGATPPAPAAAPAGSAADRRVSDLNKMIELLAKAVDLAERKCLVSENSSTAASVGFSLRKLIDGLGAGASIETKTEVLRGARPGFEKTQLIAETAGLHTCMDKFMLPVLVTIEAATAPPPPAEAAWPDPIDFRFNFLRRPNSNARLYSGIIRLDVTANKQHRSRRLASADPQGTGYFAENISYPQPGNSARGTMVPERAGDATLTTEPPAITELCFQRAARLPKLADNDYDWFDCVEGKQCQPSRNAVGWLEVCPATAKPQAGILVPRLNTALDFLLRPAYAATASVKPAPFWLEPSYLALAERKHEGVGYTVFSLDTDAFRQPGISGVEVDVRVNGVQVLEDGLKPEQRVVSNDPRQPFNHSFALQTLDFQGAQGGCDRIELGLRALRDDGSKGPLQTVPLSYVALRDVAPRSQPLGSASLRWRATYMTPEKEWRHIAELNSYIFNTRDAAARQRAVALAEEGKQWLDGQGYVFDGKKVVGVIRPPRTVKPDGSAAFGLGAGLVQDNGQVRFTFSETDARKLSAFMIGKRGDSALAARTVHAQPYIFQSASGAYTAPGICGN